jgi:chemotaxis protein methyltransferase CheR
MHEISDQISQLLGLNSPKNRWGDLERSLLAACRELGLVPSIENFALWFSEGRYSQEQLNVLIDHLTVGETYFFREKPSLELFRTQIIPELLTERFGKDQQIRIWSAGCCTGEEPYTLAMLLLETIPDIKSWNITLLATDINQQYLEKAQEGIYGAWSFRETPPDIKAKYFQQTGSHWKLSDSVKKMVDFKYFNLAKTDDYAGICQHKVFDTIFCRNVLMYFSSDLIQKIGGRFYQFLSPQGWFITSSVELSDELFPEFTPTHFNHSIVYRKTTKLKGIAKPDFPLTVQKHVKKTAPSPLQKRQTDQIRKEEPLPPRAKERQIGLLDLAGQLYRNKAYAECSALCQSQMELNRELKLPFLVLLVRSLANMGQSDTALSWCNKLIQSDSFNASNYFLMASIQIEKHNFEDAESSLKKSLYLNQDHLMSHLLLADLMKRKGDTANTSMQIPV